MEDEIFAEATASVPETHVESQPTAPVAAPASVADEVSPAPGALTPEQQPEARQSGGDLSVALRQEREERKRLQAQMLELMERVAPKAPQPAAKSKEQEARDADEAVNALLADPAAWLKSQLDSQLSEKLTPVSDELYQTKKTLSERWAVREFGLERVKEAYSALEQAIATGALSQEGVEATLRKSPDPAGEILGWFDNQPANAEKRLREKILEELRASGEIPVAPAANGNNPPSPIPSLPSLNRAVGNAGAPQSGSISDDDIFNSAPAFGKRKA
ncbi:MAG: hypothetical protein Q7T60_17255 [Sphingopyxis sp.]|nr:hypothetical protein [Sphingopyxis sp.]